MPREWGMSPLSSPRGVKLPKPGWPRIGGRLHYATFPSPRGVELHKPREDPTIPLYHTSFPSPRGVELHKPVDQIPTSNQLLSGFRPLAGLSCINRTLCAWVCGSVAPISFRPLAGLSCINLARAVRPIRSRRITFPSPRGVELHKPPREPWRNYTPPPRSFRPLAGLSCINLTYTEALYLLKRLSFRPLAGLSCINLASNCGLWVAGYPRVSVPSRG